MGNKTDIYEYVDKNLCSLHSDKKYVIIKLYIPVAGGGIMAKVNEESQKKQIDWNKVWFVIQEIGRWAYRLRSILLALPVMVTAVVLAVYNSINLPEFVGLNVQTSGEYVTVITRSAAVLGPLAVTAVCLLLMFCSKKVLYPWLISLFSLVIPLLFLFTSTFP